MMTQDDKLKKENRKLKKDIKRVVDMIKEACAQDCEYEDCPIKDICSKY